MRLNTHSTHSEQAAQADRPLGKLEQRRKRTANSLSTRSYERGLFNSQVTAHHPPELSPNALICLLMA